jgi:hypothetical protein
MPWAMLTSSPSLQGKARGGTGRAGAGAWLYHTVLQRKRMRSSAASTRGQPHTEARCT